MARQLKPFPVPDDNIEDAPAAPENVHPAEPVAHSGKRWLWIVLVVLAVAALAGGGIAYEQYRHTRTAASTSQSSQSSPSTPPPSTAVSAGSSTYTAKGQDLNLSFAYPSTWSVAPPSASDTTDQPISVTSPLSDLAGQTVKAVVQIRPAGATLSELSAGSAVVAQNSVQFAYTNPTSAQHQYPYLTFIHISSGASNGKFEEVIVTGITTFNKDQSITADSLGQLDPIITASFFECKSSVACDGPNEVPVSISADTWQSDPLCLAMQSILASIQLH